MHLICKLIFAFTVIVIANGETSSSASNPSNVSVTEIYEFWKEQEARFQLGEQKDVVLFLGNTGFGKSAAALFVTGAKLNAATTAATKTTAEKQSDESEDSDESYVDEDVDDAGNSTNPASPANSVNPGDILIFDENNKIGNDIAKSHTLIPGLLTDELGNEYYDCPGFEDTRNPKYELTIAFFLKKLMTYANSFKLVFVVPHSSLIGNERRNDFPKMVQNAVKLIKDIEHYSDAIGMVVTKVQSNLKDQKVIKSVAEFLKTLRNSIEHDSNEPNFLDEEQKLKSDSVKFIDALLVKVNKKGSPRRKIGIFRKPENVEQQFNKASVFKNEQLNLRTMINDRLKYVRKKNNDFGFVISPQSKSYVIELTNEIIQNEFETDVTSVSREVKEFYRKKENLTSDLSELKKKLELGVKLFTAIKAKDPRNFLKEILNATYVLEMAMSDNTIEPILKHIESVDFLLTVVAQKLNYQLSHTVDNIVSYLKNSRNWYEFLLFLEEALTNIGFQNDEKKDIARNIIGKLKRFENAENDVLIKIDKKELNQLLQKKIPYLESITNIDASNLKALKNVLNEYSSDKLDISDCTSNPHEMEVIGHVIKMSDVVNDECFSSAKNIKIFALNKLIVDKSFNKTGQQAQMVIIAPTWDIDRESSFILDGANGMNHPNATASHETHSGNHFFNGKKGESGKPGSAGGNFFAIGSKFINGDHLTIQVNGGNGGAGQHAESGSMGIDGRTPPVPSEACPPELERLWKEENFTFLLIKENYHTYYEYEVQGVDGTKAGDGGDGGKQGDPGLAGKIVIFELGQAAMLKTHKINGAAGAIGRGGHSGGGVTKNGKTLLVQASDPNVVRRPGIVTFDRNPCTSSIDKTIDNGKHAAGKSGNDNANTLNWVSADPPLEFDHPLYAVNEYKSFARKHSVGSTRQTEMHTFINKMTNNETLKAQYGTLDLINEFITMENQYFQMRGKINFIPPLESLLARTQELATANKGKPEFTEQKRALAYLYTAILSKINGINSKVFKNTVIDFDRFVKEVNDNINELQNSIAQNNMNTVRKDYNSQLNEKMHFANQLIETKITPVINEIFEDVDAQIEKLIEASIQQQGNKTKEIEVQIEAHKKLVANLRLRRILAPIGMIAATAKAFGPFGVAVGTAIDGGTNVIESLALNDVSANNNVASTISSAFKSNLASIGEVLKERPELIQKKIDYIDKYLDENLSDGNAGTDTVHVNDDEIKELKIKIKRSKDKISDLKNELNGREKNGDSILIPKDWMQHCDEVQKEMENATKQVKENLEKRKIELSDEKKEEKKNIEKQLRIISHVKNIVNIFDVSIQIYNKIHTNEAQVEAVSAAIGSLRNDLGVLKDHEKKIHSVLILQIDKIQGNINEMSKNLAGNSHVELDVKKWNIRSALNGVRLLFKRMTTDFNSVHETLGLCIDKLDEGMVTLINVYDQIDSYSDSAKLAAYIKNIVAHDSLDFGNTELSSDVTKLRQMIQSNIVLEEYELAMHAFKQHNFPIVDSILTQFELPESLQMTNTNAIIQTVIEKFRGIKHGTALSEAMYDKNDHYIFPETAFDGRDQVTPSPFYTWKNQEYKDQIKDLLQGKAITIKADITRGVNQNAIKFNKIGIRFKFPNGTSESMLDHVLKNQFFLDMSIVGTNYYRCKNRYYQIPLDQSIDFTVRFVTNIDDRPESPDKTYIKIFSSPAFLSPYTMWTMKLKENANNYDTLKPFVYQPFDMELIGKGYYIEHGSFADNICTDQLDKHYRLDETISNVDTLLLKKVL